MPPPIRSDVWKSFQKIDEHSSTCRICFKTIKTSGNTSNLLKHLKTHTKSSQEEIEKRASSNQRLTKNFQLDANRDINHKTDTENEDEAQPSSTQHNTTTSPHPVTASLACNTISTETSTKTNVSTGLLKTRSSQLTIVETLKRASSYSEGGIQFEMITKHLLYFICTDHRPFHIINGKGFRHLMKMIAPHVKLPSVDTLKHRLDNIYDMTLKKYKIKFKEADFYAITFDIWSEMRSARSFLGVTIHYLENNNIRSKFLTTEPLDTRHTAENIADNLGKIIQRFDLSKQNIVAAVTDRGANVVAAVNLFLDSAKHIPCFAHTINRVVDNILEDGELSRLISKVREIVKFFKNSVLQSDLLRAKQGTNYLKLILDVKTRWNSTYYMLERYIKLRSVLFDILFENTRAPEVPTAAENSVIQKIILILQPFEYVTRDLCGEKYVTVSKIIPTVNCLRQQIKSINARGEEKTLVERLKGLAINELNNRIGLIEDNNILAISTILDPRFKNLHFNNPIACARAISFIRRNVNADDSLSPQRQSPSNKEIEDEYDFWSAHKQLVHEKQIKRSEGERDETSLYLANPVSSLKSNPLEQWDDMKIVFPRLHALAKKYLIVPGTSVPSERLFSVAGATASETRNRLTGSRLNKLLFMTDCEENDWF